MNRIVVVAVVAFLGLGQHARAQSCLPTDSVSATALRRSFQDIVTSADPQIVRMRTGMKLPAATADDVVVITDEVTCARMRDAFRAALGVSSNPTGLSGQVMVIKVKDVFIVEEPGATSGEFSISMVIDSTGTVLSRSRS